MQYIKSVAPGFEKLLIKVFSCDKIALAMQVSGLLEYLRWVFCLLRMGRHEATSLANLTGRMRRTRSALS